MFLRQIWNGFDGAQGESNGWFPITNLRNPTLHVYGLHVADQLTLHVTNEDSPTPDDYTNADTIALGHSAGENLWFNIPEGQGHVALELSTKTTSVQTRQARLTGEMQG